MTRNVLWLIAWPYLFLLWFISTWSRPAGLVLLVLSCAGAAVVIVRSRSSSRPSRISTVCEECHAELPMRVGFPRATCQVCGHVQSWSIK